MKDIFLLPASIRAGIKVPARVGLPCTVNRFASFLASVIYYRGEFNPLTVLNTNIIQPPALMPYISISVIIPVINEASVLPMLIPYLQTMSHAELLAEIIIADGGSTDSSMKIAETFGVTVIKSPKGRALQMNTAAATAEGNVLYFLHADTFPPFNAWQAISNACIHGADAGCFRLQFETENLFLKLNAWVTRFNINAIRFGDQSLFVKKEVFESVGGFDEKHIVLEDQNIITRISENFRFKVLPFAVRTSDRKYRENGYVKLQSIFFVIYLLYRVGVRQEELVRLYRKWIRKGKI